MNITYLIIAVFVVMIAGFAGTLMVGISRGNRSEDSSYSKGTGAKWARLGLFYLLCVIVILAIFLFIVKR